MDPLTECLTEAELALDARDHAFVDLRACEAKLEARTPTVAAILLTPPTPEPPRVELDLALTISLVVTGLSVGAMIGAAWGLSLR